MPCASEQVEVPTGPESTSPKPTGGLGGRSIPRSGRTVVGHDGGTIGQAAFPARRPRREHGRGAAHERRRSVRALPRSLWRAPGGDRQGPAAASAGSGRIPAGRRYDVLLVGRYDWQARTTSLEVVARDPGDLVAIQTVTGLGSEMTPDPVELALGCRSMRSRRCFLAQHPALRGRAPAVAGAVHDVLGDGRRCTSTSAAERHR